MTELLSAESIIVNLSEQIELKWAAGQEDPKRPLHEIDISQHATLIGHLNLIHKNLIQVIGETECAYLQGLEDDFRANVLQQIFDGPTVAIIMADGIDVTDILIGYANKSHIPVQSCKTQRKVLDDLAR